jgi:site-specific DNA recombinase
MNTAQIPTGFPARQIQVPVRVRYCVYARKSSENEERQILSIDSQIKEMLELADREGLEIVMMKRESHSAKETGQRPIFNEIVEEIKDAKYNGILTWAPDRISRNAGDLGKIVDLMDAGLLHEIRTYGQRFTNSPSEKFLLMILGSQAKLENDNRAVNVRRGMRTRCEMGLRPGVAPVGYMNDKHADRRCQATIDPIRAPIIKQIFEKMANDKWSGRRIHQWLKFELNFTSRANKNMTLSSVYLVIQNPFYYGTFEYPEKSGNWYQGKHEPIVTKELFDRANEQLKRDNILRSDIKEFAFTKLMLCGSCGSGITADEKFKKMIDGTSNRYVYYGCTKHKDKFCKNGYTKEEELITQLVSLMDQVDFNHILMKEKFEKEVERLKKFQRSFMGAEETRREKNIDLCSYAKYVLKEGALTEKRELLLCIKSRFVLTGKVLTLAPHD